MLKGHHNNNDDVIENDNNNKYRYTVLKYKRRLNEFLQNGSVTATKREAQNGSCA